MQTGPLWQCHPWHLCIPYRGSWGPCTCWGSSPGCTACRGRRQRLLQEMLSENLVRLELSSCYFKEWKKKKITQNSGTVPRRFQE